MTVRLVRWRIRWGAWIVAGWMMVFVRPAAGEEVELEHRDDRRQTIGETLAALRRMPPQEREDTYHYLYAVERNQCQAPLRSLKVGCLLEAARRNCRLRKGEARQRCRLVSDTIIANRLSESRFLSLSDRYRIMKVHKDYRARLLVELRQRYARLVTALYLETPVPDGAPPGVLAEAIDTYCLRLAGQRSRLSWSHCVGAVVWFIGTSWAPEGGQP